MNASVGHALSITLGGAGFGLIAWLGFGLGGGGFLFGLIACAAAIALALAGLALGGGLSSLPRDIGAVRAALGGDWAARRLAFAATALALFCAYAAPWLLFGARIGLLGFAATLAAGATLYAAGMRHRSAPAAPVWATGLTPALFIAFGLASGALADAMLTDLIGHGDGGRADGAAIFLLLIAFFFRWAFWDRARKLDLAAAPNDASARVLGLDDKTLRRLVVALALVTPVICIDLSIRFGALFVLIGLGGHLAGLLIEWRLFLAAGTQPAAAAPVAEPGAAAP